MQVLLLGLFVALYLHDATTAVTVDALDGTARQVEAMPADAWPYLGPLPVALFVLGPKLVLALAYHALCLRTRRSLGSANGTRSLRRLERANSLLPLALLAMFLGDLAIGGLRALRLALNHVVLIDELLILLPTLALAVYAWWAYYPVERRLREAVILRLADEGKPVYPVPERGAYLSMQVRHQFGLLLLPLLTIMAWSESLVLLGPDHRGLLSGGAVMWLTPLGVFAVLLMSPLVIRHVWHTTPLPQGEVRERMATLCSEQRVGVRELLLWRTGGGMVNAAVTGLLKPVRYILLSDGLLDQVPPRAVEAVMAHELAHVKLHHMLWMGVVLIVTLGLAEEGANLALDTASGVASQMMIDPATETGALLGMIDDPQQRTMIVAVPAFAVTLLVFGWVSRRIERQADVFAARHLAQSSEQPSRDAMGDIVFDSASLQTMVLALQRVAELNHAPIERNSWRHGSIAWRQSHLRSLEGTPIDDTPVDRTLGRVKLAALLGLGLMLLLYFQ